MKNKKRPTIHVQYKCKDGSTTVAATASLGLLYWMGRLTPRQPIENPKPFEVHVVRDTTPIPYTPLFLSLVVAGLERTFGKAPEIPAHLHDAAHYEKMPSGLDFDKIQQHLKKGTPEIVEYEGVCLGILKWLNEHGDITKLAIDEPMKGLYW